jgi:polysaccharide pyruvyl transferase WcaK-like protein
MNIIFATTRQWNPGDEIILFGCMNALRDAGLEFNPVIFNRNPSVRHRGKSRHLHQLKIMGREWNPFLDNSVKDDMDLSFADMVVFAGSPEWRGQRLASLYRGILEHNLPAVFLGLGTNRPFSLTAEHFTADEMAVLKQARLITCRDALTAQSLAPLPVHRLPCPALLSCTDVQETRSQIRRVALMFGSDRAAKNNNVSPATYRYLESLYHALMRRYGTQWTIELVAHYIDELPHAAQAFPGTPVRYSYDARDYAAIYGQYDLVIGHRVHGIGVAASQGIPGICVSHDTRGDTVRGFGAQIITTKTPLEEVFALVDQMTGSLNDHMQRLIAHRQATAQQYRQLLTSNLHNPAAHT